MISVREIKETDNLFLEEMLYQMVFFESPELKPPPEKLINIPEIRRYIRYIKDYGSGIISLDKNEPTGAAWYILFPDNDRGYGFLDSNTPEISMAVKESCRNKGIGTLLLKELIALACGKGFKNLSLSVDMKNPSVRLYERFGFKKVKQNITDRVMLLEI